MSGPVHAALTGTHAGQANRPSVSNHRARYNLNTIRLPVGYWYFAKKAGLDPSPYIVPDEDLYASDHPITNVIRWANQAGLAIIFVSEE